MKLLCLLSLLISLSSLAKSEDQLVLGGIVQPQVYLEVNEGELQVKTNSQDKKIPVRISRRPSSLPDYEEVELIIP